LIYTSDVHVDEEKVTHDVRPRCTPKDSGGEGTSCI